MLDRIIIIAILVALIIVIIEFARLLKSARSRPAGTGLYIARIAFGAGLVIEGVITKMNLRDDQKVKATVAFTDAKGAAADVQAGSVKWSTSDATIASVTPDPTDEKSAEIVAGTPPPANADGTPGPAAVIQVTAKDVDGNDVTAQGSINVVAGDAKVGALTFGTPENQ